MKTIRFRILYTRTQATACRASTNNEASDTVIN
jgi:hypothetical protein